jgi:hypothetical protein
MNDEPDDDGPLAVSLTWHRAARMFRVRCNDCKYTDDFVYGMGHTISEGVARTKAGNAWRAHVTKHRYPGTVESRAAMVRNANKSQRRRVL